MNLPDCVVSNLDDWLPPGDKKHAQNNWLAPQHDDKIGAYRILASGPSGKGKTNGVLSMIMKGQVKFDHIYLFVRNPEQPKYKLFIQWINTLEERFFKVHKKKVSMLTIESDAENIPDLEKVNAKLINIAIFDDMLMIKDQARICDWFVRGRHLNVSCIYITQDFHKTDITIRKQCDYFMCHGFGSASEMIQLAKDLSVDHSHKEFKQILNKGTKDHSFVLLDRRADCDLLKVRKNFNELWNEDTQQFEHYNKTFGEAVERDQNTNVIR